MNFVSASLENVIRSVPLVNIECEKEVYYRFAIFITAQYDDLNYFQACHMR